MNLRVFAGFRQLEKGPADGLNYRQGMRIHLRMTGIIGSADRSTARLSPEA
jgi:hypothetical protein